MPDGVENVNRDVPVKFVPTMSSQHCSNHFSLDSFMVAEYGQRVIQKSDAGISTTAKILKTFYFPSSCISW